MIKTNNLNKYYNKNKSNEIHVIDNTSLQLPDTGLVTLLGNSGSGKTTLLNVLGGLDKAKGTISYGSEVFTKYKPRLLDKFRSKNIGYIFQNYYLLPDLSIYDNLKLALEIIGITDPEEVKKRIEYSLKAVGLFKYRKKRADSISGGQMQRVSIARALVKTCKIIIADEPTGNLDSNNSIEIMNILKKISETALVILVTHDRNLANFYSDQIIELKDGKILDISTPKKLDSLKNIDDNKVYLKDLNLKEDGATIKSKVYSSIDIPNIE